MSQIRAYDFIVGIEASAQPDAGAPTLDNDLVTLSFLDAYSERVKNVGTLASPVLVSAATAIDPGYEDSKDFYLIYVAGDGGAVEMSASPQIVAPPRAGITVQLVGAHATNSVRVFKQDGLMNLNGPRTLKLGTSLTLISLDTTVYQETSRD